MAIDEQAPPQAPATLTAGPKRAAVAVVLLAIAFYAIFIARCAFTLGTDPYAFSLFDDGMISLRYARNFAEGYGLVWNPGEPPVEGYTNFLWTVWLAGLHFLPVAETRISLVAMLSGAAILLANLAVVYRLARAVAPEAPWAAPLAMALVAAYYPLVFWTLRGMEVGLLTLLVDTGLLLAIGLAREFTVKRLALLAVVLAIAPLVRMDAVVPHLVVMGYLAVVLAGRERWTTLGALAVALVVPLGGHTAFRWSYYHDVLPNTYYLKVTGVPFADRIGRGLRTFAACYGQHLFPFIALAVAALPRAGWRSPRLLLLALVVGQAAYAVYVGGDAWEWVGQANRFVTVAAPALMVLAAVGLCEALAGATFAALAFPVLGLAALARAGVRLVDGDGDPKVLLALVLVALALFAAPWLLRTPLSTLGRGLRSRPATAGALALVMVMGLGHGRSYFDWARHNARHVDHDAMASRLGLIVREATTPTARVAVIWAGAIPYFSRRPCVDLYGKSDPVIAHGKPATAAFFPGHNKWNAAHSLDTYHPDLVVQFWHNMGTEDWLRARGYDKLQSGLFVRHGATNVDRSRLDAEVLAPPPP